MDSRVMLKTFTTDDYKLYLVDSFDVERDCFNLYSAMAGSGCDEEKILDILTMRNNQQRQELRQFYMRQYKNDLAFALSKNLGGNFNQLIVGLLMPTLEYLSMQLHKCVLDAPIIVEPIVEIIMTVSWNQWLEILRVYKEKYAYSLRDELLGCNIYCIRRWFKLLLNQPRKTEIDAKSARTQAVELQNKKNTKICDLDVDKLNRLLALCSFEQLRLIFEHYEKLHGICIEEAIQQKLGHKIASGYLTAVACIRNSKAYFANRLYNALQPETLDCKMLIRIICCRSEFDLADIKEEYFKIYGHRVFDDIESTNIDFKRALCNLVAGVPSDVIYF